MTPGPSENKVPKLDDLSQARIYAESLWMENIQLRQRIELLEKQNNMFKEDFDLFMGKPMGESEGNPT